MTDPETRPYDLIVFGATSFVGEILVRHLVERHGTDGELRWAIAGRSEQKLSALAGGLQRAPDQILADAASPSDMHDLVSRTRLVISTVGPYAAYGSLLVGAAASAGTDYCDLTGEPHWMRRMIDAHHDEAAASGARIVHACGFDSIPSDLGVLFLQQAAIESLGEPLQRIAMRVKTMKGGPSGGTLASLNNTIDELREDRSLRSILMNPHALAPEGQREGHRQPDVQRPTKDPLFDQWVAPFVMASVNTKVVHRSHALLGHPWGVDFEYDEAMLMGEGPAGIARSGAVTAGLGAFMAAAAVRPLRKVLTGRILPAPGDGPTPDEQRDGFFDIRLRGVTKAGERLAATVTADRDPGYGATGRMLGEAAVVLLNRDRAEVAGGFHTPATALGQPLIAALEAHAGMRFELLEG